MEERIEKKVGIVVFDGERYWFKSTRGHLFDIIQNDAAKNLAGTNNLCIFKKIKTNNPNDNIWTLDKVSGKAGDPIPEGLAIAEAHDLIVPLKASEKAHLTTVPKTVREKDTIGYVDARDIPFVTIDPDTAKDYDDAVYAKRNSDGSYTLKVAIANVAHYIAKGTPLYERAMNLANSSYLGDCVYPMFPELISTGICSLNEGVDRLTMCTTMIVNPDGSLKSYMVEPAVIRSRHRLTYKEADFLAFGENADGDEIDHSHLIENTKDVKQSLDDLYDVSAILYNARMRRGAFDIQTPELVYELDDEKKKVISYCIGHNEEFTNVIEETAILTNEVWGEMVEKLNLPFCYRNHENVPSDRVKELSDKLKQFNIKLPKYPQSSDIQAIFNQVRGKRIEDYVVRTILQTMHQAYYDNTNIGHAGLAVVPERFEEYKRSLKHRDSFEEAIDKSRKRYFRRTANINGLAFEGDITHSAYAHTTSPIRRAPDLINQGQILNLIMQGRLLYTEPEIESRCDNFNYCERNSQKAEWEYNDMLSAKWAENNINHVFEDCTVVSIGENHATVLTKDKFKMLLPYGASGYHKKHLKIGQSLSKLYINHVSIVPAAVYSSKYPVMTEEQMIDAIKNEDKELLG